jgi:short-subunit dehydrogenase
MAEAFADRVVLITGAGSGIGRQLAVNLSRRGARLAVVDLNPEPLEALAAELNGKTIAWQVADVTDRSALTDAVSKLHDRLGPTDLLIANAGIGRETSALDLRAEDVEAQVKVNLIGVSNSIAAVLPGMLARRSGHLVGISSLASFRGLPKMAGYCAAKAGVNALLDAFRIELKPHNIAVTTICPGWIRTPLTTQVNVPQPDMLEVDHAVECMVEAIRRRRTFYAFPARSAWRVRLLRMLPVGLSDWMVVRFLRHLERKHGVHPRNNP